MPDNFKQVKIEIVKALKSHDWTKGIKLLEDWCGQAPDDAQAWYYRAYFFARMGRFSESKGYAEKSRTLDPSQVDTEKLIDFLIKKMATAPKKKPGTDGTWRAGDLVEGRYEVKGSKKGGMGEVYFAYDREIDRMVAIKAPLPALLETEAQKMRFYREAEAWIGLGMHPHICSAYYVQEIGIMPWLFIEYVDGGTLDEWLKHKDRPFKDKLDIAIQITSGMNHTHTFNWRDDEGNLRVGLVHRDLKPANILMDQSGKAKVTDFGLVGLGTEIQDYDERETVDAKALLDTYHQRTVGDWGTETEIHWQTITVEGIAIGTPPYMAPEQWTSAHAAGFPADIYAYGCLLYEIFCGRRPFILDEKYRHAMPAHKIYQWEKMHLESEPPDPRDLNPKISGDLAQWMQMCLAKDPAQRPQSFLDLREALKAIYSEVDGRLYPRPEPRASRLQADSLNNQGVSFITIGQIRRADAAWREALRTDPHHIEATFNKAVYEWNYRGMTYDEFCRRMEELTRTHKDSWRHRQLMGRIYIYFGEYQRAVKILEEARELDPTGIKITKDLALARLAQNGQTNDLEKLKEIEELFRKVLKAGYEDPVVISGLLHTLLGRGRKNEAQKVFNRAAKRHRDIPATPKEAIHKYLPGQEIMSSLVHTGWINHASFGPDSQTLNWAGEAKFNQTTLDLGRAATPTASPGAVKSIDLQGTVEAHSGWRIREMVFKGGRISSVAVGHKGSLILSGDSFGDLRLWDRDPGRAIMVLKGHRREVSACVLSTTGKYALSGSKDFSLRLWDLQTGKSLKTFEGHTDDITAVAFRPGGRQVISASADKTVRLWDRRNGQCILTYEGHTAGVNSLDISRDGQYLVTAGSDRTVRLWNIEIGRCFQVFEGHTAQVNAVAFHPQGRHVISGSHDKTLRLWDVRANRFEKMLSFEGRIDKLAVNSDGNLAAVVYANVWPSESRTLGVMEFPNHDHYNLSHVVTLPSTTSVAEEREREFLLRMETAKKYLDKQDYRRVLQYLKIARGVTGYERDPDAVTMWDRLATPFPNKHLNTAWEIATDEDKTDAVLAVAISAAGQFALSGGRDKIIKVWDIKDGRCLLSLEGHNGPITAVASVGQGKFVISGSQDRTLRLWNLETRTCIRALMEHTGEVTCVAASPDGRYAVSGGRDKRVLLWDLLSETCIKVFDDHTDEVNAVAFSPDGTYIVSGGKDLTLRFYDLTDMTCYKVFEGHSKEVTGIAISPCGRFVMSACADEVIRRWELDKEDVFETLKGHKAPVTSLAISPDSKFVLSGSEDRTLILWDLKTGKTVSSFEGHTAPVTALAFSPDGRTVASTSLDKTLRLWHLDWEPDILDTAPWHEGIRPFLKVWLTLHRPYITGSLGRKGKARWNADDFHELMASLYNRGYGWITPDGIRQELKVMAIQRKWTRTLFQIGRKILDVLNRIIDFINSIPSRLSKPGKLALRFLPAILAAIFLNNYHMFETHGYLSLGIVMFLILVMMIKW